MTMISPTVLRKHGIHVNKVWHGLVWYFMVQLKRIAALLFPRTSPIGLVSMVPIFETAIVAVIRVSMTVQ